MSPSVSKRKRLPLSAIACANEVALLLAGMRISFLLVRHLRQRPKRSEQFQRARAASNRSFRRSYILAAVPPSPEETTKASDQEQIGFCRIPVLLCAVWRSLPSSVQLRAFNLIIIFYLAQKYGRDSGMLYVLGQTLSTILHHAGHHYSLFDKTLEYLNFSRQCTYNS